ncbi:hypothetical protein RYH80_02850 [Halobaculum sp. MBLA0147]|uniref:hypothetical protein n=1 Tax=Halobaculum sp. MBLA0147 TaxID=3079934 RepID=UPI003525647D
MTDRVVVRRWHGWTTSEDADAYERLVSEEVLPDPEATAGYLGHEVLRRAGGGPTTVGRSPGTEGSPEMEEPTETESGERDGLDETETVEFCVLTRFASWEAVESFAGPEPATAHVPESARALLVAYDEHVTHYERAVRVDG